MIDDDTTGISFNPATVTVNEEDNADYTVRLDTQPTADVIVGILSDNTEVTVVSSASLTFTPDNWNTMQTITVTAEHDDDAVDDSVILTHTATGGDYTTGSAAGNNVTAELSVTVDDNDTAGISFNPAIVTVNEEDNADYTVRLDTQPIADVIVGIVSGNSEVIVSSASLTFTPTDWNTTQTITVTAADDADAVDDSVMLTHTATGGDYNSLTTNLEVIVIDDDTAGITFDPAMLTVDEETTVDTYTVVLNTQPTAGVTIAISSDDDISGQSPTPLTFTTSNWNTPRTVTVNAARDDNAVDDSATLTHTATGGDYEGLIADLAVTIIDSADIILGNVMTNNTLVIQESIATTYTVVLGSQPTAEVTITIANDGDVSVQTPTLNFTTSDWDTPQTVRVRAAHDDDAVIDNVVLTHTAMGADYASLTTNLEVIVIDDDTAGISFNPDPLTVVEEINANYTVRLDTEPTADVVVRIVSGNPDEVTVFPTSLTFTPTGTGGDRSWRDPQTITVTAADDDDAVDDSVILTHTATGGDYTTGSAAGNNVTAELSVAVDDDDTAGITFNPPRTVTVNEGANETYTIVLDTEPSANVTITIDDPSRTIDYDSDISVSPSVLTFTPTNWRYTANSNSEYRRSR